MQFVRKNAGFALITALLLMGFLMTLIISLSVLLRVDFQLEDDILAIKQAKANARIALQIALGEVQRKLGPDINYEHPLETQGEIIGKGGKIEGYYSYAIEDLTLSSNYKKALGILSDAADGGLKKDLSLYLSVGQGLKDEDKIIQDMNFSPRWGIVKSFYETCRQASNDKVKPRGIHQNELLDRKYKVMVNEVEDPVTKTHVVGPVIVGIKFGVRPSIDRDEDRGFERDMKVKYFVSLELWNPYEHDLCVEEYFFEVSSRGIDDNIIYLNTEQHRSELKHEKSLVHATDKAFFRCDIKGGFKAGEVKSFSISSDNVYLDFKHGNQLVENASINNFVLSVIDNPIRGGGRLEQNTFSIKEEKCETISPNVEVPEKEIPKMRGGGKAPPRINTFFKKVPEVLNIKETQLTTKLRNTSTINLIKWGGDRNPKFTFVLALRRDPNWIFQKLKELKVENWDQIENPDIVNNDEAYPLFAVVFEHKITKDSFKKYNARSQCVWVDDDNIEEKKKKGDSDYPYITKFWIKGRDCYYEGLFQKRCRMNDLPLFRLPRELDSLSMLRNCNMGLHENVSALALGSSFKNIYIAPNMNKSEVPYLYDLAYHLNNTFWNRYFFAEGKKAQSRFFKLSDKGPLLGDFNKSAAGLLIREVFNVNSTSKEAWIAVLSGLRESPGRLTKEQIEQLAHEIVKQVKERGPFRSLGDFVNRRLEYSVYGECGLIQAVLNKVGLQICQYDVLDIIGDKIAVRSDSCIIRAYGEAVHHFSRKKVGCHCEAVVQRVPEYIEADKNAPEEGLDKLTTVNRRFGRRYKIVSFRWLKGGNVRLL